MASGPMPTASTQIGANSGKVEVGRPNTIPPNLALQTAVSKPAADDMKIARVGTLEHGHIFSGFIVLAVID